MSLVGKVETQAGCVSCFGTPKGKSGLPKEVVPRGGAWALI